LKIAGIILIILGVIALVFGGITYTTKEKVIDLGPIEATAKKEKTIPLPPVLGAISLIGGIVLLVTSGKRAT
jgi:uncharacterized membrane protein HdeD (DUF308 family)